MILLNDSERAGGALYVMSPRWLVNLYLRSMSDVLLTFPNNAVPATVPPAVKKSDSRQSDSQSVSQSVLDI